MTTITVMFQNIETRADVDGRWAGHLEVIKREDPDVLILTEVEWLAEQAAHKHAEIELGMHMVVGPSRNLNTAVAWKPGGVLAFDDLDTKYAHDLHHGYTAPRFTLTAPIDGRPHTLTLVVIGTHLSPYSAATAAGEASILVARAHRYGGLGLIAGDINHCPIWVAGENEPAWEDVPAHNRSSRCLRRQAETDPWVGNQIVGQTLRDGAMTDVAAHLAKATGDMSFLEPTGKSGLLRVDQAHVTEALVPAITGYRRVDNPHADHHGGVVELDLTRIDPSRLREYA